MRSGVSHMSLTVGIEVGVEAEERGPAGPDLRARLLTGALGALHAAEIMLLAALEAQLEPGQEQTGEMDEKAALLARINAYIDERLADPELSPATIAAAHHISIRYLHKLFETQQTTVAGSIRRRRLDRCRRDLVDPAARSRPIGAIAARWGFTDPASFSRLFRATYGVPPGRFRSAAASGQAPASRTRVSRTRARSSARPLIEPTTLIAVDPHP